MIKVIEEQDLKSTEYIEVNGPVKSDPVRNDLNQCEKQMRDKSGDHAWVTFQSARFQDRTRG